MEVLEIKKGLNKKDCVSILKKYGVESNCKDFINLSDEEFQLKDLTSHLWNIFKTTTDHVLKNAVFMARGEIYKRDADATPLHVSNGRKYTYNRSQQVL